MAYFLSFSFLSLFFSLLDISIWTVAFEDRVTVVAQNSRSDYEFYPLPEFLPDMFYDIQVRILSNGHLFISGPIPLGYEVSTPFGEEEEDWEDYHFSFLGLTLYQASVPVGTVHLEPINNTRKQFFSCNEQLFFSYYSNVYNEFGFIEVGCVLVEL